MFIVSRVGSTEIDGHCDSAVEAKEAAEYKAGVYGVPFVVREATDADLAEIAQNEAEFLAIRKRARRATHAWQQETGQNEAIDAIRLPHKEDV